METLLEKSRLDTFIFNLSDESLNGDFDEIFKHAPLPKESHCGIGSLRGRFLQKCSNKKCFIFVFGIVGLIFSSTHAYYNGTISTLEKRFKIPSKNMGFIATGNDITGFMLSTLIAYYGGKGHRPRWMAFGVVAIVIYCLMNAWPHFLYGPGEDALSLTVEYGSVKDSQLLSLNRSINNKMICQKNVTAATPCQKDEDNGNLIAQIFLFVAQLIAGVGQSLKHTLGISYLDDNIKKSKTPALISLSYFIRLLGPAFGYALASFCLSIYIAPHLTPTINNKDPRWVGAWYLGWILLAVVLSSFSFVMALFPKELPRAALRRKIAAEKERRAKASSLEVAEKVEEKEETSVKDFLKTSKRLFTNKLFMLNNIASVFYVFGFMPFWIFSPKLIETLFRQTSSASSLFTGTFGLVASALGILVAGCVITKYKPSARYLAFWNVVVGVLSVISVLSNSFLGCEESKHAVTINNHAIPSCNSNCYCDFVKYSPVCGADGITYITPCHAGCASTSIRNSTKYYGECSCVDAKPMQAIQGPCYINCQNKLTIFLFIMCFLKFIGSASRASNFLVGIRCVEERDKTLAIGFGMSIVRLLASVPSPIFFGYILDQSCIAWGKTCSSKGNCWLYDGESLRYWFFYCSAFSIAIGTFFDFQVWRYAKNLKIFEDEDEKKNVKKGTTE